MATTANDAGNAQPTEPVASKGSVPLGRDSDSQANGTDQQPTEKELNSNQPPAIATSHSERDALSKETQVPSTEEKPNLHQNPASIALPKDKEVEWNQRPSTTTSQEQDAPSKETQVPSPTEEKPEGNPDETPARSKLKVAVIMFALGLAVFLAAIDITIITTALPTISEHFHSSAGYTWIGSSYLLANAASTPIWGKISDIFGRKPILLIANIVFFIGSLIAGLSINIGMLIAARAIQGIGGGGLIVLVNICIGDLFSMRDRGAYYGIIGGVWAIASSLGPIVGGAFTEKVSWRWCFYINLPIDGVALVIIFLILDLHTPRTPLWEGLKAIDWLGSLSMVGGTLMFLFGLEFGGISYPWSSATVLCLLIFGVLTVAFFFLIEAKIAPYPLMPLSIFSKTSNMAVLGACFCHAFVFIAGSYYLPLYFQAVLGATPLLSGVYLLPTALALSFTSMATGIFIKKTGKYLPPIWTGFTLMTLGFGLLINLKPNSSWAKIIIYQIIAGIGVGPNFQAPLIALQSFVAPRDIATATATFGFVRSLATAISVVVGNVVFQNEMKRRKGTLTKSLSPGIAAALSGGQAGSNVAIIKALPGPQREIARNAFADSLSTMWIMYVVFAAVGLLIAFTIGKNVLSRQHVETKTGMETEKERRRERENEKVEKKEEKARRAESRLQSRMETLNEASGGAAAAKKEIEV